MSDIRGTRVSVGGVGSTVLESGPPENAEAVVFVHGNPCSSEDWRQLVSDVGEFARALAPDLPSFGRADRPRTFDATVPGYAAWLGGALDQRGVGRAHLVLHDWGGGIGLRWASDNPDKVASITLCNIGVQRGYEWHSVAQMWRKPVVGEVLQAITTPKVLARALTRDNPHLPHEAAVRMGRDNDRGTKKAALSLYRSVRFDGPEGEEIAERIEAQLGDKPVNVLWGAKDPYINVSYAERQKETWHQATVTILPEAGHWPFLDEPGRSAEVILPFLREQTNAA